MNVVLYVHGKGGSAAEAEHYKPLFPSCDVVGLDYKSDTPWEIKTEIKETAKSLKARYGRVILIANSIGAFFCMNADIDELIFNAYFISPIVDMEKLILDMMVRANITELELQEKGIVQTDFGEELSWEYLSYVRNHPIKWNVPTEILYGGKDYLTAYDTIAKFSQKHNAQLTVMENGEHWFHTKEQIHFLDNWIGCRFESEHENV
ncbi:MAG: alpha/beta hydrolase [Firmicutes bacterium]|nr:alpha/beta hydrolase [Bacillota bacterium]